MLSNRQNKILKLLIKEHVKTAEPVGSEFLAKTRTLHVSPATIRKEMLVLDKSGFLKQPHTSAGRIPTQAGYNYLLQNKFKPKTPLTAQKKALNNAIKDTDLTIRNQCKQVAKALSKLSNQLILIAFSDNDFYYTGLSRLFSKPEFRNQNLVCNVSGVIDHLDLSLYQLFGKIDNEIQVLIGSKNPVDKNLSLISAKVRQHDFLCAMLGPIRMNYKINVGLLQYVVSLIVKA